MQTKLWMLLKERGFSQKALAEELGISEKTLSLKLRGQGDFWWGEVAALSAFFGIENPLDVFVAVRR